MTDEVSPEKRGHRDLMDCGCVIGYCCDSHHVLGVLRIGHCYYLVLCVSLVRALLSLLFQGFTSLQPKCLARVGVSFEGSTGEGYSSKLTQFEGFTSLWTVRLRASVLGLPGLSSMAACVVTASKGESLRARQKAQLISPDHGSGILSPVPCPVG